MRDLLLRARRRLGRRGSALLALGILDLVYASNLAWPAYKAPPGGYLSVVAPLWLWAIAWAAVGVVLLITAWVKHDQLGYALAVMIKLLSGLQAAVAWLAGLPRGYVSAAVWLSFACLVAIIAQWPEPRRDP